MYHFTDIIKPMIEEEFGESKVKIHNIHRDEWERRILTVGAGTYCIAIYFGCRRGDIRLEYQVKGVRDKDSLHDIHNRLIELIKRTCYRVVDGGIRSDRGFIVVNKLHRNELPPQLMGDKKQMNVI